MRSYIKPPLGMAFAQIDVGAEEIGIAAGLSGDPTLQEDYRSGDPYRQFAAAALGILKPTEQQRQIYKATVLGRIYGLGVASLARNLGISKAQAQRIINQMNARYPALNAWLQRVTTKAAHIVPITCTLGWSLTSTGRPGDIRTFLNYPMQGNGSELMRLVIVRAGAAGLHLIGCAHDSFLIEAPIADIDRDVAQLQDIMRQASRDLLGGFELRADCNPERDIVRFPARFIDKREMEDGMRHWDRLMTLIGNESKAEVA
jgi:DNA polymerase I-like protein with 3'-5' exonuclease and polymerase domains